MKKFSLLLSVISIAFISSDISAQDYQISFAGTGESTMIDSVKVENFTSGAILTIKGNDILLLSSSVGIHQFADVNNSEMRIYPNPMLEKATIEIAPPVKGDAIITIYELTGKPIAQVNCFLEDTRQEFSITGSKNGLYLINVTGNTFQFSGRLQCNGSKNGNLSIEKVNTTDEGTLMKKTKGTNNDNQATVEMPYTLGDRLKLIAMSGDYGTVNTLIPTQDETIAFNFVSCTDGDNNSYPIVEIGTQIWMAENLKTTKYNDGTAIPNITDDTAWATLTTGAYSDYNNTPANSTIYGRLYNWYAVDNNAATKVASNGGKNVCPTGWHVPSDTEWTTLTDYLTNNGYGYEGSGNDNAKSMAATSGWTTYGTLGTVGNDQASNNSSGFTALPSGCRVDDGAFGGVGNVDNWWSSTEYSTTPAYGRYMNYTSSNVSRANFNKHYGFSVRCLRD